MPERPAAATARVLPAKLVPPVASPSELPRTQLLQAMLAPGPVRLVLVRAAAGFGKTTLLQQYRAAAQAGGRQVLWLNLDAADNDLRRFVAHLEAGFDALAGEAEPASELLERLAAHGQPFAIVLDEFESIQDESVLNYVQQLVEGMPPHGLLLVASRTTPALGLGRIRARGQLLEIGPTALRFSLEEARDYLRERQQLPLRDAEIATLHRCTEGWAAAIYLASLSLHTRSDHAAFVSSFSGSNVELAQYLAEDILARQDEATRDFLLATSVLDTFCASLCDAVTGRADAQQMIEALERANLFVFRLDPEGHWFRYHSLFASFLRGQLERRSPGRAPALHRAAAAWYAQAGRHVPAVDHLLHAGAEQEALDQIALCARELQSAGRVRLLLRWFDGVSPAALAQRPELELAYAWALMVHRRRDEALRIIARVQQAAAGPAQEALANEAETIRCVLLTLTDRVEEGYEAGKAHLDGIPLDQPFQHAAVANALAFCLISMYRYDDARRVLSRAMRRDALQRSPAMLALTEALEGIIELLQGRLGNAVARLRTAAARGWEPAEGDAAGGRSSIAVPLALALYECDERDEAQQVLADVLPYVKSGAPNDSLIVSHMLLARMAQQRGDRELALRTLAELEEIGRQHGATRIVSSAWLERARFATLEGRFDAADQAMRSVELHADWVRPGVSMHANDVDSPMTARARLRIARGDCAGLLEPLRDGIAFAGSVQRYRCVLKLKVLLALALDRLGREEEAFAALTDALRNASHEGFVRVFLDEGELLEQLLRRWHAARREATGIAPDFVATLLAKVTRPEARQDEGDDALSGRELQVLRLMAEGLRNKAIADKLFLSEFTVKAHLRNINSKLGAHARTEAVAIARKRGLVD